MLTYMLLFFLFVLDTKNSVGVGPSNVDEISHNAVVVRWNPRNSQVRVCLNYALLLIILQTTP